MLDHYDDHRAYMQNRWLAMERYRLRCIECRPDGPDKRAVVAAIHATIESLSDEAPASLRLPEFSRRPQAMAA